MVKGIAKPSPGELATIPYRQHPRYRGCVGHWLFTEKGGDKVRDISGYGNDGTLTNMAPASDWVISGDPRLPGYALDFDGTNDFVQVGQDLYESDNKGTITAWAKVDSLHSTVRRTVFSSSDASIPNNFLEFGFGESGISGKLFVHHYTSGGGNNNFVNGSSIPSLGQWYFVALVSDGSSWKMYLDGIEESSYTIVAGSNNGRWFNDLDAGVHDVRIARRERSIETYHFDGSIADVRVYNRALTPNEIQSLYEDPLLEFQRRRRVYFVPTAPVGQPWHIRDNYPLPASLGLGVG